MTKFTIIFNIICGVWILGVLIFALIVRIKNKKKGKYSKNSDAKNLNILKSKARKQCRLGMIPLLLNEAIQRLTLESSKSYVNKLMVLYKQWLKPKGYYKKNKSFDSSVLKLNLLDD